MTKDQAIKRIKEIQNGKFNQNEIFSEIPLGQIAVRKWNDPMFIYGMEYGMIMGLMIAFNIKKDELNCLKII